MILRILAAFGCGSLWLLYAADAPAQYGLKQKVQVSNTQRTDFPAGGTLRFKNSVGVLTVEAWDQPGVEITTIKSTRVELGPRDREKGTRLLDKVNVAAERHGDEVVIATTFPGHRPFRTFYPLSGNIIFDLEYRIKAPANARIVVDHTLGEVNIDGLVSDIQVNLAQGEILLHLPEDEKYDIYAKSSSGSVNSDFSERERRTGWPLGHRSVEVNPAAMHKLNLKVGLGDIVILKIRTPKAPPPVT